MKNEEFIYLRTKNITSTFNVRVAVRNILFVLALSAFYILARQYYGNPIPSSEAQAKIINIKGGNSLYRRH
jgi:hypothetical protein